MATTTKLADMPLDERTKSIVLLEHAEEKETKTPGRYYLNMTITDGETETEAKLWNACKADLKVKEPALIMAELYPKMYNNARSYEIYSYGPAPDGYKIEDYILSAPIDSETMYQDILAILHQCLSDVDSGQYAPLTNLVDYMYGQNHDKLLRWSAAVKIHHNFYGGWLYHTDRMVRSASVLVRVYPVDKEVLLCATALHDIGKLRELKTDDLGIAEYTPEGNDMGHSLLGIMMVEDAVRECGLAFNPEKIRMLEHAIASHHGEREYGAIALPATPEASLLHEIDMIDSREMQYETEYAKLEPGEMSDRNYGLGTCVHKPQY